MVGRDLYLGLVDFGFYGDFCVKSFYSLWKFW